MFYFLSYKHLLTLRIYLFQLPSVLFYSYYYKIDHFLNSHSFSSLITHGYKQNHYNAHCIFNKWAGPQGDTCSIASAQ